MTAILATSPWPRPTGATRGMPWLFGREVVLTGVPGTPGVHLALQWLLRRNCAISPRQLGLMYLSLCGVCLTIAGFFYAQGAPFVLAFAGLELLAVGLALLAFARHAGDRETLTLVGRSLQVEQCFGTRVQRTEFAADWLRVEPAAGQGSLVELSSRGQSLRVGRFLRPELRGAFARELRHALRRGDGGSARPAGDNDSN